MQIRPHDRRDVDALTKHLRDAERRGDRDGVEEVCGHLVAIEAWETLAALAGRLLTRAETTRSDAPWPHGRLVVFRSSGLFQWPRAYSLNHGDRFTIGRDEGASICIRSVYFSPHHFSILRSPGGFVLRDNNTTGGTFINDQRVAFAALTEGDQVSVADVSFRFEQDGGDEQFLWSSSRYYLHPTERPEWIANLVRRWAPRTPTAPNPLPLYLRALRLWIGSGVEAWLNTARRGAVEGDHANGTLMALLPYVAVEDQDQALIQRPDPRLIERGFLRAVDAGIFALGPRCPALPEVPNVPSTSYAPQALDAASLS